MENTLPLAEQSIYQIYLESQETRKYVIPIYQRNYAWEEDEITALIKDIYDSMHKDCKSPYYIGTLVTYKHGDNEYEVIDGQQRLTTIYIILKAFGDVTIKNKLTYSAREISASTIRDLPKFGEEVDNGIRNGYKYADNAINTIVSQNELPDFKRYFLNNVHIISYQVPKDVDLNHYFEVMNSRGEQLEKHEIVKSELSEHLKDKAEMAKFSRVWEACSEMNVYIQQAFRDATNVFGTHLDKFLIDGFDAIPKQDESDGKARIIDLMDKPISKVEDSSEKEQNDKFQPIIDFPNFLLVVLKVTRMQYGNFDPTKFTLDDKELLNEFDLALENKTDDEKAEFARRFSFNLLKAKYFLDNFMVHHSLSDKELTGDNPWKLQYYFSETKNKRYPKNLSDNQDVQKELVHLLSMFEVTFTPKQRKNYLFYCLMYLFGNSETGDIKYLEFVQMLAHKYFYDVYMNRECLNERNQPGPNVFDITLLADGKLNVAEIENKSVDNKAMFNSIYKQGSADIPLFVFNYTDYILWKKYADELRGNKTRKDSGDRAKFFENLGCSDFGLDYFDNFYFSRTRKSLEHYYPQAKAGDGKPLSKDDINCFGNFAMIGAEANSSGSDWDPKTKLDHYSDSKADQVSVASLKFKIMMQVCQDNLRNSDRLPSLAWNSEDMQKHQREMLDIIFNTIN